AAEQLGFHATALRGSYDHIGNLSLPAILHVINDRGLAHFVVLYQLGRGKATLADPECGIVHWSRTKLQERWTGFVVALTPDPQRFVSREATTGVGRQFLALLRPHVGLLIEAVLCAVVLTLLGLLTSFAIQQLVDNVLVHSQRQLLNAVGIALVTVAVLRS